jgi:hypothetical protein
VQGAFRQGDSPRWRSSRNRSTGWSSRGTGGCGCREWYSPRARTDPGPGRRPRARAGGRRRRTARHRGGIVCDAGRALGYGFPIGGVAATDIARGGVVSPGGVGFDIACGVRLLASDLNREELLPVRDRVMDRLADVIPCGAGRDGLWQLRGRAELDKLLAGGAGYAVAASRTWTGARIAVSRKTPTWRKSPAAPWTGGCTRSVASGRGTTSWKSRRWTGLSAWWRRMRSGWPKARSAS